MSLTAPALNGSVNGWLRLRSHDRRRRSAGLLQNVSLNGEWLLVGLNTPLPGGCTLLASPDLVIPLPPQMGSTKIVADLPHDPALIGTSIYMQVVHDGTREFSNGLELKFTP